LLADAVEFVKLVKKAAVEAYEATKPVQVCFGKVIKASPLEIIVDQKLTLGKSQLVLAREVTDYTTEVTVDGEKKKITIHNGLVVGNEVILLRQQDGQKYIVVDRTG